MTSIFVVTTQSDPNVQSIYCIIFECEPSDFVRVSYERVA